MIRFLQWRRLVAIIAAISIPIIIFFVAAMMMVQANDAKELRRVVDLSYQRRAMLQIILSEHQDIETGQRGYLLSGDPSFLDPYLKARQQMDSTLAQVEKLQTPAAVGSDMTRLRYLTRQKLAFSARTIALRQNNDFAGAQAMVIGGDGKRLMDGIRAEIGQLRRAEEGRLAILSKESDEAQSKLRLHSFLLLGLLTTLLCISGLIIFRAFRARAAALARLDDLSRRREAILDGAMDAILILNPSGSIEGVNKAASRIYGYTADELLRRDVGMLFADPPPRGQVATYLRNMRLVEGEPGYLQEIPGRREDGTVFPCDVAVTAVLLADGIHYVVVARDISERKRVERLKAEFVASVSHELRTPLTSIAGSLGLLVGGAGGVMPDRAQRLITIAHDNAERLVRLINDILDIEKIDSDQMTFNNSYVDLGAILQQAVEQNRGYADRFKVSLNLGPVPINAYLWADADRLMQVLANLISNAAKFSPPGETVDIITWSDNNRHRISICDRGAGIDEAFRSRIFNRFAQADSSDTRQKGGTGLGLSIVREIVTKLGGEISFDSELGKGSQFHIDLPAARPEEAKGPVDRLLICERDLELATQMSKALEASGLACDIVHSTTDAMEQARTRRYRVVLVDSNLPSGGGIGLVRNLRRQPGMENIPILMISADSRHGGIEAEALRIVDWLQKPVPLDQLITAVRQTITHRERAGQPDVLHVDDDPDVLRVVATALEGQVNLTSVTSVQAARVALSDRAFDLAILDLGLADGSGLDLLPNLRVSGGIPIPVIIFSAQDADPDVAASVQAYLTKSRTPIERLVGTVQHLWQQTDEEAER